MSSSAYKGGGQKVQKVMVQPINLIFRFLQNKSRIQVWLYENVAQRIEGRIIKSFPDDYVEELEWFKFFDSPFGFDEYMNLVLDDAEELCMESQNRKPLGRILLKGENITLLMSSQDQESG